MSRRVLPLLGLLAACWGSNAHILEGEVVELREDGKIVIAHEDVPGLMPAMTMPFTVKDPALLQGIEPGDQVYARLIADDDKGWYLAELREHRKPRSAPKPAEVGSGATLPAPVRPGQILPATAVPLADGGTFTVGAGQSGPVVLTFLYTTCPQPEFCPAIATRLQGLQAALKPGEATLLAVSIDPQGDTPEVLKAYAAAVDADPAIWRFGRLEEPALKELAARAALTIDTVTGGTDILHSIRILVLDGQGRLVERYDDARFPAERVLEQLRTGGPPAPEGSDGTLTPDHP